MIGSVVGLLLSTRNGLLCREFSLFQSLIAAQDLNLSVDVVDSLLGFLTFLISTVDGRYGVKPTALNRTLEVVPVLRRVIDTSHIRWGLLDPAFHRDPGWGLVLGLVFD